MEFDEINHPSHYRQGSIEAIAVIESVVNSLPNQSGIVYYCLGNAIKYLVRAGHKKEFLTDIKKAIWYLNKIVETYDKK